MVGLAPDARILPVRVLDEENRYDDALIVAKGVRWAVDNGAQVINMSLGGTGDSPALAAALDYAFARNVVVVACTGNLTTSTPTNKVWYPAREPGVVAVAGLDHDTDGAVERLDHRPGDRAHRPGDRPDRRPARRVLGGAGHQLRGSPGSRDGGAGARPLAADDRRRRDQPAGRDRP